MRERRFRPSLDALESRSLLSISTIPLGSGRYLLDLQGTDHSDVMVVADGYLKVNSQRQAIPAGTIGIYADARGDNDLLVNLQEAIPVILHGGEGDDLIWSVAISNPAYVNILYGDAGHNLILADPTLSAVFQEEVVEPTVDAIGPVVFFSYTGADDALGVFDLPGGNRVVVELLPGGGLGQTLLPPSYTVGIFRLGRGDDTFADFSPGFHSIVYGGPGDDFLQGDEVFEA